MKGAIIISFVLSAYIGLIGVLCCSYSIQKKYSEIVLRVADL